MTKEEINNHLDEVSRVGIAKHCRRVDEIKKQFLQNPPLIYRIADAIVKSDLLEEEKKHLALDDLLQMYKDPNYYKYIFEYFHPVIDTKESSIMGHHEWVKSQLGFDFWFTMHTIIGKV